MRPLVLNSPNPGGHASCSALTVCDVCVCVYHTVAMVVVVDTNSAENDFAATLSTQLDGIDTVHRASLPVADVDINIEGFRLLI